MTDDVADADRAATGDELGPPRRGGRAALQRFDEEFLAPAAPPKEPPPPASFADRALGQPPSPLDRIDRLFQQTPRRIWWGVAALGAIVVAGVVWSAVVERVATVQSAAVIVPPDGLFSVRLVQAGQVDRVAVEVGDTVSAGATLADLRLGDGDEPVPVQSPIDGTVVVVGARDGDVAAAGTALFVVAPNQDVAAVALFPAGAISSLEVGQDASVAINGVSPDRYGRVRASVQEVGDVPLAPSRLAQLTADPALAAAMSDQGVLYEVIVELDQAETPSGLAWTHGDGPEQAIPVGALAEVSVVVDRAPLIRDVLR